MNKQQKIKNLSSSILTFFTSSIIGFLLTPYLLNKLGIDSYGFISLSTQIISYVSLISVAINSMAGRFISIEIFKSNIAKANSYFNSVFFSNIFLSLLVTLPYMFFLLNINSILTIPPLIENDVKILFFLVFINYLIVLNSSTFGVATFTTNKLNLDFNRLTESNLIKIILIYFLFTFFEPKLFIYGIVLIVMQFYTTFFKLLYTRRFTSNLFISFKLFSIKYILELFFSGIWNLLLRIGHILMTGFDLLLANLFLDSTSMGTLSIAKTLPNLVYGFIGSFVSVFIPDFTFYFAKNDKLNMLKSLKSSIKLMAVLINIPIAILLIFGNVFYRLWIPGTDAVQLQLLTFIIVAHLIVSGSIHSLYNIYTVTNKLKANTIVNLCIGLISIIASLLLLNYTELGLYGIVLGNTIIGTMGNLTFTPIYSAKILGLKWNTFYVDIFYSVLSFSLISLIFYFISHFINPASWLDFFLLSVFLGIIGLIVNVLLLFSKEDKNLALKFAFRFFKK
jgi:O-antigen/teichoic acid export membrane protein